MITVATMATPDYEKRAQRLGRQAEALGMGFHWQPVRGTRDQVVRAKPFWIAAWLDRCDEILWVDADDEMLKAPLPFPACDVGIWRNPELSVIPTHLRLAPAVYVRRSDKARMFLHCWQEFCQHANDHRALECAYIACMCAADDPQWIADISVQMRGVVRMNPSAHRQRVCFS